MFHFGLRNSFYFLSGVTSQTNKIGNKCQINQNVKKDAEHLTLKTMIAKFSVKHTQGLAIAHILDLLVMTTFAKTPS